MALRRIPDPLPESVEAHRDIAWRRLPELTVDSIEEAERFVTAVGLAWTLTDVRTPGPSLYIAVCGRRDAHMPPNVQKDPEASAAWILKDWQEAIDVAQDVFIRAMRERRFFDADFKMKAWL